REPPRPPPPPPSSLLPAPSVPTPKPSPTPPPHPPPRSTDLHLFLYFLHYDNVINFKPSWKESLSRQANPLTTKAAAENTFRNDCFLGKRPSSSLAKGMAKLQKRDNNN
ncbi:MAG: hypothetical protein ACK53Y_00300, partial [bacterium]